MDIISMMQPHKKCRILQLALTGLMLVSLPSLSANTPISPASKTLGNTSDNKVSAVAIKLQYQDTRLSDAMADVSRRSKVRIVISPDLGDEKITVKVNSANWNHAIKSLLVGFNHIAIVDRRGDFRKIWITGRKDPEVVAGGVVPGQIGHALQVDDQAELTESIELPMIIWEPLDYELSDTGESITAMPIQMDPSLFETLQIGQPIEIPIPQEQTPLFGVIGESHQQLNGAVQVWSGPIDGSHETASFTVTRGEVTTYVTVATGTSIYEVTLDNTTGIGSVVNEVDLTKDVTGQDFLIPKETSLSATP